MQQQHEALIKQASSTEVAVATPDGASIQFSACFRIRVDKGDGPVYNVHNATAHELQGHLEAVHEAYLGGQLDEFLDPECSGLEHLYAALLNLIHDETGKGPTRARQLLERAVQLDPTSVLISALHEHLMAPNLVSREQLLLEAAEKPIIQRLWTSCFIHPLQAHRIADLAAAAVTEIYSQLQQTGALRQGHFQRGLVLAMLGLGSSRMSTRFIDMSMEHIDQLHLVDMSERRLQQTVAATLTSERRLPFRIFKSNASVSAFCEESPPWMGERRYDVAMSCLQIWRMSSSARSSFFEWVRLNCKVCLLITFDMALDTTAVAAHDSRHDMFLIDAYERGLRQAYDLHREGHEFPRDLTRKILVHRFLAHLDGRASGAVGSGGEDVGQSSESQLGPRLHDVCEEASAHGLIVRGKKILCEHWWAPVQLVEIVNPHPLQMSPATSNQQDHDPGIPPSSAQQQSGDMSYMGSMKVQRENEELRAMVSKLQQRVQELESQAPAALKQVSH